MEARLLGNVYGEHFGTGYAGNVWDSNYISPTLTSMQGGGRQPMIIANINPSGKGYIECEVGGVADLSYPTCTTRRGRVQDSGRMCPTITATETGVHWIEKKAVMKVGNIYPSNGENGNIYHNDGIAPTIKAGTGVTGNGIGSCNAPKVLMSDLYRIRKLIPLETWRLMDFSDEDFRKAESVNSNTQLYKQAGNSIVRNVLVAIFGQMMPGKENAYKEGR